MESALKSGLEQTRNVEFDTVCFLQQVQETDGHCERTLHVVCEQ